MIDFEAFRGRPELEIAVNDARFDEPIEEVNRHLSQFDAEYFFRIANNPDTYGPTQYAIIGGGDDRSHNAVIPMPAPRGNGVWPHILARGEAISHMAAEAGLRDSNGNLVPVAVIASPNKTSSYGSDKAQRKETRKGNVDRMSVRQVTLLDRAGFGAISGFAGYSEGSVFAESFMNIARGTMDTDGSVVLGAPAHASDFNVMEFAIAMGLEGMHFSSERKAENIKVIEEIFATHKAAPDFWKGMWTQREEAWALLKAYRQADLASDMAKLAFLGHMTTVLHASKDHLVPRLPVKAAFDAARKEVGLGSARWLGRIEVLDADHNLGDRVGRLAVLMAAGLTKEPLTD
ncbi:MAG TPA: hypothetical protein VLE74_03840 [Candidatus Saccharimonadales bacterium]|nr:hypothetical protein [Candidatus Saccharimonadales bacterium]